MHKNGSKGKRYFRLHSLTFDGSPDRRPQLIRRVALPGSRTNPNLTAARFLLKPGRKYDAAVKTFQPYDTVKEPYPDARAAGRALIAEGIAAAPDHKTYIYANNRLEGNALGTIDAMLAYED